MEVLDPSTERRMILVAILMSKDKKELILSCDCGCDNGLHIRIDKDTSKYLCYISYISGDYYRNQYKK